MESRGDKTSGEAQRPAVWQLLRHLESTTLDRGCADALAQRLTDCARVRAWLDAHEAAVGAGLDSLAARGRTSPVEHHHRVASRATSRDAKKRAERSRTIARSPELGEALAAGTVTADHVDVIGNKLGRVNAKVQQHLLARGDDLVQAASSLSVERFRDHLGQVVDQVDEHAAVEELERQQKDTKLSMWIQPDTGMYHLHAQYDPVTGERVFNRIRRRLDRLWHQKHPTRSGHRPPTGLVRQERLAAQALAEITERPTAERPTAERPTAERPTEVGEGDRLGGSTSGTDLVVLIDYHTLVEGLHPSSICETGDGTRLPAPTARRLACEAGLVPVVLGGGPEKLDVGRRRRLATRAQRRALRAMYATCAFPTCRTKFAHCQVHHVNPWESSGNSDLGNLIPLCTKHHHLVHEGRWQLKLLPDRTLKFFRPDGAHFATAPPPEVLDRAPAGDRRPRGPTGPSSRHPPPSPRH